MTKKRNRDKFNKFYFVFRSISAVLRLFPIGFSTSIYNLVGSWHGLFPVALRYCVLLAWCKKCGRNVRIENGVELVHLKNLSIGSNVSINCHCYIDSGGGVEIGDDVSIAHQTSILSFDHTWNDLSIPIKDNPVNFSPITIANDVWLGCGCRVLSGVKIYSRSIVAAGAVVTRDVPPHTIVGGVPAKVLKEIEQSKIR